MRWVLLTLASAVACTGSSTGARPPQQTGTPGPPASEVPREWSACSVDADCTEVARVCCACAGTDFVRVHRTYESQARARFAPAGCADCPPMRCHGTTTVCRDGACVEGPPVIPIEESPPGAGDRAM